MDSKLAFSLGKKPNRKLEENTILNFYVLPTINLSNLSFSSFLAREFLIREVFLSDNQSLENVSLQIGGPSSYWW